jgi:hypothetical protein
MHGRIVAVLMRMSTTHPYFADREYLDPENPNATIKICYVRGSHRKKEQWVQIRIPLRTAMFERPADGGLSPAQQLLARQLAEIIRKNSKL